MKLYSITLRSTNNVSITAFAYAQGIASLAMQLANASYNVTGINETAPGLSPNGLPFLCNMSEEQQNSLKH